MGTDLLIITRTDHQVNYTFLYLFWIRTQKENKNSFSLKDASQARINIFLVRQTEGKKSI